MAVTLKDISRACGINVCSVSQVLSGHPRAGELSVATRKRILSTARDLGYCRNELARSVVTGKSNIISVIVNNFAAFPPILDGICAAALEHDLTIKFISLHHDQDLSRSLLSVRQYRSVGLLGVAFEKEQLSVLDEHFLPYRIPAVVANTGVLIPGVPVVSTDQAGATHLALEHLYQLGHRKIACLGNIPPRCAAYEKFMRDAGLAPRIFPRLNPTTCQELCESNPDAIFCCCDNAGVRLLQWLYQQRIFVPECFSVMGFGGLELSAACSPALSTVQEPFFDIGYQMLKILHDLIQGRSVPQHLQLPAQLLQRESTSERLPAT